MAIAGALNILLTAPTQQLKSDLKDASMSFATFNQGLKRAGVGVDPFKQLKQSVTALKLALNEDLIDSTAMNKAFDKVTGLEDVEAELDRRRAAQKAADEKQSAANAKYLAELRQRESERKRREDEGNANYLAGLRMREMERLRREREGNAKYLADLRIREAERARIEREGNAKYLAGLRQQYNEQRRLAADRRAAMQAAQRQALFAEANELNLKHASAIETLNQRMLKLNALKATGALTERAYAAEVRAANVQYQLQASGLSKLGLSMQNLKMATGLFNPWFAAIGALAAGVKIFGEFERSMDRASSLSGATAAEMGELAQVASDLGRTTVFSAKDAAEGMATLAKAGFNTTQIMQAAHPTMRLAAIGMIEVGDAAEIASRIMAGMHIPASQLSDAVDSIAVAATSSVNSVEDLGEALKFVGPVAQQAGMSLDDVMASLMILGNSGLQGELGGTGLRNSILRISKPTDEAAAAIDRLGIVFEDASGRMLPMVSILSQFETAMQGMGDMEKLRVLNEIFKTRTTTTMAALINAGPDEFQSMLDLQGERKGLSKLLEEQLNDNFFGDIEMLGSALSGLATDSEGLGAILRFLTNSLTLVTDVITGTIKLVMGGLKGIIAMLAKGLGAVLERIPFTNSVGTWLTGFGDAMLDSADESIAGGINAWVDGVGAAGRTFGYGSEDAQGRFDSNASAIGGASDAMASEAQERDALQRAINGQKKVMAEIDKAIEANRERRMEAELGADATARQLFLEQGLAEIEAQRQALTEKGSANIETQLQHSRDILDAKLDALAAEQEMLRVAEARRELTEAVEKAAEAAATVGMSDADKMLYELGNAATEVDRAAAARLDALESQKTIAESILDAERQRVALNRDGSKYDESFFKAYDAAMRDGAISAQEDAELKRLDTILAQNEAIDEQVRKRKAEDERLKKYAQDMRAFADDLNRKHNPIEAFTDDFVKLRTMLQGGLIDEETFGAEFGDLLSKTLKSTGPKNIGYSAAVTDDSAEGYSAMLRQTANPEFEELKRQTDEARRARSTLSQIERNTRDLQAGELLDIGA